jgi:hypothetical protein
MSTDLAVFTLFHVALSVAGIIRLGADFRETVENLDQHISADYHSDQRDRILVSVPQILAFAWRWNRFLAGFGDDDSGSLRLSPCRCLAARLCYRRGQRALSERLRVDRAVFHEDSRAQGSGAHTIRTAISRNTNRRDVDFHRAGSACDQEISWATGSCILSAVFNSEESKVRPL